MTRKYVSPDGFRAALKSGEKDDDLILAMAAAAEVKAADDQDRAIDFTISTGALDRHGDRVNVDGWHLDNYRKNPVVLFCHDHSTLPVARAEYVRVEDGKLKARAVFTPPGMARFNDTVFDMYNQGFMRAVSVGFKPVKWAWAEGDDRRMGIDFQEQELLEFSVVCVPANPECSVDGTKAAGVDASPIWDWMREKWGFSPEHVAVAKSRLAELHAAEAELKRIRAKQLITPEPAKHSRLTRCALKLARLKG